MRALEAGAADFLSKPVDRAELSARVRNLLRLKAYDQYSQMLEAEVVARTSHLRASEARFRRPRDSGLILILIAISDERGRISDVNEAGAHLLGYSRSELISRRASWQDLTAGESKAAGEVAQAQLASCGVTAPWEMDLLRKDGTRVPVLTGAAILGEAEGIAIAIDLTERKEAERADHERMRIAELTAQVGVALTQSGPLPAVLQRCAEAIAEHAGASAPALEPETRAIAETRMPHVTNDLAEDPGIGDGAWAAREGLVSYAGFPLLACGQLVGVLSMFSRRALSAAALNMGEALRAELEAQLRQAQKMEAVGRLAGGVANDYRSSTSTTCSRG